MSVCRQQLPVPLLLPMTSPDHTTYVHMWRMVSCLQLQSTQWCALNSNSLNASESLEHNVTLTNNFWAARWVISNIILYSEVIAQPFFRCYFTFAHQVFQWMPECSANMQKFGKLVFSLNEAQLFSCMTYKLGWRHMKRRRERRWFTGLNTGKTGADFPLWRLKGSEGLIVTNYTFFKG